LARYANAKLLYANDLKDNLMKLGHHVNRLDIKQFRVEFNRIGVLVNGVNYLTVYKLAC
jgi:hypothetical protein